MPTERDHPVNDLVTYCVDIGSVDQGNLGWARRVGRGTTHRRTADASTLAELVASIVEDLAAGRPVALGFEAPLWLPLPSNPDGLTRQRDPEDRGHAWSAGAAPTAGLIGLVEATWILREVRRRISVSSYFDWSAFEAAGQGLFLYEALVTGTAKVKRADGRRADEYDAERGAAAFDRWVAGSDKKSTPKVDEVISLIGVALIRAGWTSDLSQHPRAPVHRRGAVSAARCHTPAA